MIKNALCEFLMKSNYFIIFHGNNLFLLLKIQHLRK